MKIGSSAVLPFVILVLVNLMWAFQFSGAKIATEELGSITVTFLPLGFSVCPNFIALGTVGIIASQLGLTAASRLRPTSQGAANRRVWGPMCANVPAI